METTQLSERQEKILCAIVEGYTASAHPVGSAAIVAASGLSISAATVRHEMSVLEDRGYVMHLHTSGGRVPTNDGYRYYVERLMRSGRLPDVEARTIRHQFHQAHTEVQEWLKLAATIMATRLHNVGLITTPTTVEVVLRHIEVIAIQRTVALLIVVLQDGAVLQEMVTLSEPHTQEELSVLSDRLNADFCGRSVSRIDADSPKLPPAAFEISTLVLHLLRRRQQQHTEVVHAGLSDLIQQPEFLEPRVGEPAGMANARLRHMVEFLRHGMAMEQLISGLPAAFDVQVVIGGDHATDGLRDYSFVLGRYGSQAEGSGFLGVVGPTRMEYPRAVALVRYMRELMTDLLQAY